MSKRVLNIDQNEVRIEVIGRNGSGKGTVALMLHDFLKAYGLQPEFISSITDDMDVLRESHTIEKINAVISSIRKVTIEDIATEKPPVTTKLTFRLMKDIFGCPAGRLFQEDVHGDFFHVMTDEEKSEGIYFQYSYSRKHVLESIGVWFEEI